MKPVKAKIYWVQVCSYPSCDRIEAHAHEFFHYIYVIHGTGSIQIGEHSYAMTPKHMYLVAPKASRVSEYRTGAAGHL